MVPRLTRPDVGSTVPAIRPSSVDLPLPFAPMMLVRSPGATGFSYRVFLAVDVIAGLLWAGYSVAIGTGASSVIGGNHLLAVVIGILAAVAIGALLDQLLRRFMPVRARAPRKEPPHQECSEDAEAVERSRAA